MKSKVPPLMEMTVAMQAIAGSSESEPPVSEVSDQYSMLEQAYHTVKNVLRVTNEGELVGGELSLNVLESLPLIGRLPNSHCP